MSTNFLKFLADFCLGELIILRGYVYLIVPYRTASHECCLFKVEGLYEFSFVSIGIVVCSGEKKARNEFLYI